MLASPLVLLLVVYCVLVALLYLLQDTLIFVVPDRPLSAYEADVARWDVQPIQVTASDGVKLYGWHSPGAGRRAVVFFHGNGGGLWIVPWLGKELGDIDVFGISYRGYPGSEGSPTESGLVADARGLYAHVRALGFAPEDILVVGHSLGGGVAHALLAEEEPAGAVFVSTFLSLEKVAADAYWFMPVRLLLQHRFRSDRVAPTLRIPTLVIHGDRDTLIPVEHGRALADLHPNGRYVEIPGTGHQDWQLDDPVGRQAFRAFVRELWPETTWGR